MGLDNLPDIVTVRELVEFLKISESTIRRAIKNGELKSFKAGKNIRIEREAVINWVEKN